jgi:hypothetical protein
MTETWRRWMKSEREQTRAYEEFSTAFLSAGRENDTYEIIAKLDWNYDNRLSAPIPILY